MSESGILVVISGRLRERVQIDNRIEPICVSEVSGTEKLVRRIDVNDEGLSFTAVVAIDNIVHIAWIASQVLNRLLLL